VILVFNNSKEKLSFNLSRLTKDIFEREVWFNDNKDRYKKERAIVEKELTNQVWYKMTEKERKDWMIARKLWTEEEVEKYWW
jgi:hypothetical protein